VKLRLLAVGKVRNAALRALCEDYTGRIGRLTPFEFRELADGRAQDPKARLREEAAALGKALGMGKGGAPRAVLWDEKGETLDTAGFARFLERGPWDFVIGSSHGVDPALKAAFPRHLRLSAFTLTHEWARALALEQIYRGLSLSRGLPYHH
jgi:23S rRNA (pseudouridine1915-N3)-methyltransferase